MIFQAWNSVGGRPVGWEDAKKKSAAKGTCFAKVRENACFQDHFFWKRLQEFHRISRIHEVARANFNVKICKSKKRSEKCFKLFLRVSSMDDVTKILGDTRWSSNAEFSVVTR